MDLIAGAKILAERFEAARPVSEPDDKQPRTSESQGTCTDCQAQNGPCWCGDTLGCNC